MVDWVGVVMAMVDGGLESRSIYAIDNKGSEMGMVALCSGS